MKDATRKVIDTSIDDYFYDMVDVATKTAVKAHILGDIIAFKQLKMPIMDFKVQEEALWFGRRYRSLMIDKGASVIQGKEIPWLSDHTERTRAQLHKIIETGLKEGKPVADIGGKRSAPGTIAHDLKMLGIRDKDYEYVRISRTETMRIKNQGTLNRFAKNNLTHVYVTDGMDDDDACRAANGQMWTIEYARVHEQEHPNCRRTFRPVVPDEWEPVI